MRKASLAIFCFLFMTLLCAASDVCIVHFDNDDGLDHNIVTCIIQDREGYIWLSSRDGLSRYDGYSFVKYKAQPGDGCPLESNRIDQSLWQCLWWTNILKRFKIVFLSRRKRGFYVFFLLLQ